jgi:hypothetical protein
MRIRKSVKSYTLANGRTRYGRKLKIELALEINKYSIDMPRFPTDCRVLHLKWSCSVDLFTDVRMVI